MARVPGWADAAARMNAAYPAPTEEDAVWADAIIFGTPTRFGAPASELRAYIDTPRRRLVPGQVERQGRRRRSAHLEPPAGGNESTLLSLYNTFAHLGLIIVPTGYADGAMFKAGTPYGATAVVPPNGDPKRGRSGRRPLPGPARDRGRGRAEGGEAASLNQRQFESTNGTTISG